jgi:hypothetical protein
MDTEPNRHARQKRILAEIEWERTNSVHYRNCATRPSEARQNHWIPPPLNQDMPRVISEEKCLGGIDHEKSIDCLDVSMITTIAGLGPYQEL